MLQEKTEGHWAGFGIGRGDRVPRLLHCAMQQHNLRPAGVCEKQVLVDGKGCLRGGEGHCDVSGRVSETKILGQLRHASGNH